MPAAPATVKNFTDLIVRSRLLSADAVQAALKIIKPSGKEAQDVDALRRALIVTKQLTEYQAALLVRGHSEGFFLGPYRILELIAKGRMAGVYRAAHESGQIVAIKVLPASKAKDVEVLARFKREARLLTRLDHPNVVRIFHVGETNGTHYLVLEYLDGDTLDEILEQRKRLAVPEAVRLIQQALLGLQHIHERGTIHRDLKPANLMLVDMPGKPGTDTLEKTVKILDIGLGKAVFDESETSHLDDPSKLTTDGVLIGTPDYLAPEQARSARKADIRSDIYSLGCLFYHTLTGQPPFPDKSILNTVMRHATETPKPLSDFLPQVPDGLQNVMNWMLAKDPALRYATPDKAAQALSLFLRNTPAANTAAKPLPSYEKWLASTSELEPVKATPLPGTIATGKLESSPRKTEPPRPVKPGTGTAPAVALAAAPTAAIMAHVDVELVPVTPQSVKAEDELRGLFEFNKRDVIMMVLGALMVILAITAGWGLNRLLKREPPVQQQAPVEPNPPVEG